MNYKTMKFLFVILIFPLLSYSAPTPENLVKSLETYFQEAEKTVREQMRRGFPEIGVPSIDPLEFDPKVLEINEQSANVVLNLHKITVTGISEFSLDVSMPDLKVIVIRLNLDDLAAKGLYNVMGKILRIFPLYGNGAYHVSTYGAYLQMTGEFLQENGKIVFSVKNFEFDYEELELNFENFLGGKSLSQMVQKIIPLFAKRILEKVQPEIEKVARPRVESLVNNVLTQNQVQDILQQIFN